MGIAELLKSGDCSPEETDEYLDAIIDQSKRLATLSSNILYLTKLETETAPPEMKNLNLSELLRQRLVLFDYKCSQKHLDIKASIDTLSIYGNSDLLSQMMSNILDNAIKFSPEGSSTDVELWAEEDYAVFRVKDYACGMDRETITVPMFFQQTSRTRSERFLKNIFRRKKIK